jgi:chorismate mutase|tara:strand:+ start:2671 stop:2934 length:264 start_codon:yes stop_codon:yes gene_type:complete
MKNNADDIQFVRRAIDEVDAQILELLVQRCQLAVAAAVAKNDNTQDAEREQQILAHVSELAAQYQIDQQLVADIFEQVLKLSRKQQR